jgi:hypothetical protein
MIYVSSTLKCLTCFDTSVMVTLSSWIECFYVSKHHFAFVVALAFALALALAFAFAFALAFAFELDFVLPFLHSHGLCLIPKLW